MKSTTIRALALVTSVLFAYSACATETVWFSTSNTDPGAPPAGGVNTITFNTLGSKTLFIWTTDGTSVSPLNAYPPQGASPTPWPTFIPPTDAFYSYNLGVTGSNTGAISLTAGSLNNPNILDSTGNPFNADTDWSGGVNDSPFSGANPEVVRRWNAASSYTAAANPTKVSASAIIDLTASTLPVAIDTAGIPSGIMTNIHKGLFNPANTSFAGAQPGYNGTAHAYLLGQVTFDANAFNTDGSTVLGLNNSAFGLGTGSSTYDSTKQQWVGVTNDLTSQFTFGHVNVDIVPEPATWLLMAIGGAAICLRRGRASVGSNS